MGVVVVVCVPVTDGVDVFDAVLVCDGVPVPVPVGEIVPLIVPVVDGVDV